MSRRTAIVGMAMVLAAGVALRCFRLSERSVWFDEASAVTMITRFGWGEMFERCAQNVHPPLYYFALRSWAALFGDSVFALRSMSVLLGTVTIVRIYLFARDAYRLGRETDDSVLRNARGIGVTAAALLAVSSSQIVWAQQIRMYMLGTALAAFSSWALVRALLAKELGMVQSSHHAPRDEGCVTRSVTSTLFRAVEPKLFVGEQSLSHYLAQPLLTDADRVSTPELRTLAADRLWVLDTTGFRVGYRHALLPEPWRPTAGSKIGYPEVFCFQGEVSATVFERQGTGEGRASGNEPQRHGGDDAEVGGGRRNPGTGCGRGWGRARDAAVVGRLVVSPFVSR